MSFDIAAFLGSCIGPDDKPLTGRFWRSETETLRFMVVLGKNAPDSVPDFDVTWCPDERILNIGTYVSVERFGIRQLDDAILFAHSANIGVNRIGNFTLVHMGGGEADDGGEVTDNDAFQHQASFVVPPRFDEPASWPMLGEIFKGTVLQLFTEQAIQEKVADEDADDELPALEAEPEDDAVPALRH